jgi:hypothetical protein
MSLSSKTLVAVVFIVIITGSAYSDIFSLVRKLEQQYGYEHISTIDLMNGWARDEITYGDIDGGASVDTINEILLVDFLGEKMKIIDSTLLKNIEAELPVARHQRGIQLAALQKKKAAETEFLDWTGRLIDDFYPNGPHYTAEQAAAKKQQQLANYAAIIKKIADKENVSAAEIDKYYSEAMTTEIDRVVDDAYSTVEITLPAGVFTDNIGAIKIVKQNDTTNGKYKVYYKNGGEYQNYVYVNSLDELPGLGKGFTTAMVSECRKHDIPIKNTAYDNIDKIKFAKDTILNFYLNPSQENFDKLCTIPASFLRYNMYNANYLTSSYNSFFMVMASFSMKFYTKVAEVSTRMASNPLLLAYSEAFILSNIIVQPPSGR